MLSKIWKSLLILTLILFTCSVALCRNKVEITAIYIGNVPVPTANLEHIVISDEDNITFNYKLIQDSSNNTSQIIMYKPILRYDTDEYLQTVGKTEVLYSNLKEGDYTFEISCFDRNGEWVTPAVSMKFRVNNTESALTKQITTLEKNIEQKDSTITQLTQTAVSEQNWTSYSKFIIIGLSVVSATFIVLLVIFHSKYAKQQKTILTDKNNSTTLNKKITELEEYIKNNTHTEEVEKLQNKIDSINKRIENIFALNEDASNEMQTVQNKSGELAILQENKNGMFKDILYGISNPTSAIKGLVELLRQYDFNAVETHDIVSNIIDTTRKIIDISEDIQRLIEFETENDTTLQLDSVEIKDIITDVVQRNINDANKKSIHINASIAADLLPIRLDPQKVTLVLHNLVNNAIKFTENNGNVTIHCYIKNNSAYFEINDTGVGIDKKGLQKIYENMASTTPTINRDGTIGLLTVKKYVEAHNGKVMVSSKLGSGSTFTFYIPYTL